MVIVCYHLWIAIISVNSITKRVLIVKIIIVAIKMIIHHHAKILKGVIMKPKYRVKYLNESGDCERTGLMAKKNAEKMAEHLKRDFKKVEIYKDEGEE